MDAITARLRRDHPDFYPPNGGLTFGIVPLHEQVVGDVRRSLLVLVAAGRLRAADRVRQRRQPAAVARARAPARDRGPGGARRQPRAHRPPAADRERAAGARRRRAGPAARVRWSLEVDSCPRRRERAAAADIAIDGGVLLFTLAVSLLSGVLFGLAPALRLCRLDLHEQPEGREPRIRRHGALWGRGRTCAGCSSCRELALSVMLLIGAGLLVRSFVAPSADAARLQRADVLTLELTMSGRRYTEPPAVLETYRQLWERLDRLPGVTAAGGVSALPLSQMFSWGPITVEGRTPPAWRSLHQRRPAHRRRQLLPGDGDPAAARALLQRARHAGQRRAS